MPLTTNQTDGEAEDIDADEWVWVSAACSFRREASLALTPSIHVHVTFTPDFIDSASPGLVLTKGGGGRKWIKGRGVSTAQTSCVGCKHFFFFPSCFAAATPGGKHNPKKNKKK